MTASPSRRLCLLLVSTGVSAALLLTACVAGDDAGRSGMMGGGGGYHYSRLTCSPPAALPGTAVRVVLVDMGMTHMMGGSAPTGARMMLHTVPAEVPAGQVSFVAQNLGWRTHELVVLPLADASSAGRRVPASDGKVNEGKALGEASASCAGGPGEGIISGAVGWVTLTLAPGRYELVCNLKNHYADGMYQQLDVR